MQDKFNLIVDESNIRLDQFLSQKLTQISRSKIQSAIKTGHIQLDGEPTKSSLILKGGEIITGEFPEKEIVELIPENIPLNILFEDEHIIVVNKSSGMVTHPGSGNYTGTLANALKFHFDSLSMGESTRPGIVHRLDKETSGVIVVAKTDLAHQKISEQFAARSIKKIYNALVWGKIVEEGDIDGLIGRHPKNRQAFTMVNSNGRESYTSFMPIENLSPLTFLKLFPQTGRTHQIRVHLKSIGHPIFGDELYGGGKKMCKSFHVKHTQILNRLFKTLNRVALHAEKLEITHPDNGELMEFSAPLPDDMKNALEILKNAQ